jgi:hypothetical protein
MAFALFCGSDAARADPGALGQFFLGQQSFTAVMFQQAPEVRWLPCSARLHCLHASLPCVQYITVHWRSIWHELELLPVILPVILPKLSSRMAGKRV